MVWSEQRNHGENYFFYLVNINNINLRNQSKWTYSDLDSVKWLVTHSIGIPISLLVHLENLPEENESSTEAEYNTHGRSDSDYERTSIVTHGFNHLIRGLILLKKSAELLAYRLAEKRLIAIRNQNHIPLQKKNTFSAFFTWGKKILFLQRCCYQIYIRQE